MWKFAHLKAHLQRLGIATAENVHAPVEEPPLAMAPFAGACEPHLAARAATAVSDTVSPPSAGAASSRITPRAEVEAPPCAGAGDTVRPSGLSRGGGGAWWEGSRGEEGCSGSERSGEIETQAAARLIQPCTGRERALAGALVG